MQNFIHLEGSLTPPLLYRAENTNFIGEIQKAKSSYSTLLRQN